MLLEPCSQSAAFSGTFQRLAPQNRFFFETFGIAKYKKIISNKIYNKIEFIVINKCFPNHFLCFVLEQ